MRTKLIVIACVFSFSLASAQQSQNSSKAKGRAALAPLLEAKIRQAWEDYKNKDKNAFARILTDDVIEVEEDGNGARDKKAELAEMDEINLASYVLGDFYFRRIGSDGMLVRYKVEYTAKPAGETIHNKSVIGEVWEKRRGDWKLVYLQETKIN
jgi:hypothetical protein